MVIDFPLHSCAWPAPKPIQLMADVRRLRHINGYSGRVRDEDSAFARWHYQFSWDTLRYENAKVLEGWIAQLKYTDATARVPIWPSQSQQAVSFNVTGGVGGRQITIAGTAPAQGDYFNVGDQLYQVLEPVIADQTRVFPALRQSLAGEVASTAAPTGLFVLNDLASSIRWGRDSASADLDLVEFF